MTGARDRLLTVLWPDGARMQLWVILDAARDRRIFGAVDGCYLDRCCLYGGELPWQLQMSAPYLVQLPKDSSFTNFVLDNGWGDAWGIFLHSEADLRTLRKHLRGFLRVRGPKGRRLLFRYYDPRVLRVYLPTCTTEELRRVFGPVTRFLMESEDPSTVIRFSFDGFRLNDSRVSLAAERAAV